MRGVDLRYGAVTDVGLVREVNEDSLLARPPVFVVADGMGGHDGGDVASAIVVEEFGALADAGYDPTRGPATVATTLQACQDRIEAHAARQRAGGHPSYQAGTTAVAAVLVEDDGGPRWLLANLGDSRAYRLDGDRLEQVTVDHSLVQELVEAGTITAADASHHPERHVVTRALGAPGPVEADYFLLPLDVTSRLLLCSDGITGMLDDAAIADVLARTPDPADAATALVGAAVAAGGLDNATAVVVDVVGWTDELDDDSERQQVSLEEKLGALP